MPSEVPLSIPGLPAGWKFGDEMPTGFIPEPEKPNVALEIAQSTQKKRRRPDQPVIFQVHLWFPLNFPLRTLPLINLIFIERCDGRTRGPVEI